MIAIIDYGMGNIHSVKKALELYGAKAIVTNQPKDIRSCTKAVLPGVGAFDDAMLELEKQSLKAPILEHIKDKKPFLGICLGMQLLFQMSQEAKKTKGLGILKGSVDKFTPKKELKVPHMGWNQLSWVNGSLGHQVISKCPLLKGIPDKSYVYFCHSYYPVPKDRNIIAATTDYGIDFSAVVWQENTYGVQFHPEKSQATGLKIIENFVKIC